MDGVSRLLVAGYWILAVAKRKSRLQRDWILDTRCLILDAGMRKCGDAGIEFFLTSDFWSWDAVISDEALLQQRSSTSYLGICCTESNMEEMFRTVELADD
jgi:hypothetical protein